MTKKQKPRIATIKQIGFMSWMWTISNGMWSVSDFAFTEQGAIKAAKKYHNKSMRKRPEIEVEL